MSDNDCFDKRSKKRKKTGRVSDASKRLRAQSHEIGEPCDCSKQCFDLISQDERNSVLRKFNELADWNKQSLYLAGQMSVKLIRKRRPHLCEKDAKLRDASYGYTVRIMRNDNTIDINVCEKAFRSIHGISSKRLQNIQKSLKCQGVAPTDMRGKHTNRPHKISSQTLNHIKEHISSFQTRLSHYSLQKSKRKYLPEDLNVKKMHAMYKDVFPNNPVSYETYRNVFVTDFNISFGLPRSDTCSTCNEHIVKSKFLKQQLENHTDKDSEEGRKIEQELKQLEIKNKVHKMKADTFYKQKSLAKQKSMKDQSHESICMDFQKNLPTPNISTSIVYYKRQLSMYSFNVHRLSDNDVVIYAYSEEVGCKGSNEVVSFLYDYVMNKLSYNVKYFEIFCDSCGCQNKNYTLIRFCHYLVCDLKRFETLKVTFPIKGHSYMEYDKDVALINTKLRTEVPEDWLEIFKMSRCKPKPFNVTDVDMAMIRDWNTFLQPYYRKKCVFLTRPIRELLIKQEKTRYVYHRDTFNGSWATSVICLPNRCKSAACALREGEFLFPDRLYEGIILLLMKLGSDYYRSRLMDSDTDLLLPINDDVIEAEPSTVDPSDIPLKIKVYKRRWLIISIFVAYSIVSALQWTQYSIIANLVMKYYGVSSTDVDWTSMVLMVTFIPLILPASYMLDRLGLKWCLQISALITAIGSWIKVVGVHPDGFYLALIGQSLIGIGQVFMLGVPPRLATVWFGANEVSTACSLGVFGNQCGMALGFLLPPVFVQYHDNKDDIGKDMKLMFELTAGACSLILFIISIFFKERPCLPPSPSQARERFFLKTVTLKNFLLTLKRLLSIPGYTLMLACYGISIGVFNALCTILNQLILIYFEKSEDFAGRVGLVIIVGGMVGCVLFGMFLDKTHSFKESCILVYLLSFLSMLGFTFILSTKSHMLVYIVSSLLGLFLGGYFLVGFEMVTELTYPESESTTAGLLLIPPAVLGIIFTIAYSWIMKNIGDIWGGIAMSTALAIGTFLTLFIKPDYKRLAGNTVCLDHVQ